MKNVKINKYKFAKAIIIKRALKERMSIRELSRKIEVPYYQISHYETQHFSPRSDNYEKICDWLGVDYEYFKIKS